MPLKQPASPIRLYVATLVVIAFTAVSADRSIAQPEDKDAQLQDQMWAKEQSIYQGRTTGSLDHYIGNISSHYLAWPPFAPAPFGRETLKKTQVRVAGGGERLTMDLKGFTHSGDTAVIYYSTHRTTMADGAPVDQTYENIHVWTRESGAWRLIGGMARLMPAHDK